MCVCECLLKVSHSLWLGITVWVFVMCSVACLFIRIFVKFTCIYMVVYVRASMYHCCSVVYFFRFCLILCSFFHFHEFLKRTLQLDRVYRTGNDVIRCSLLREPREWLSVEHITLLFIVRARSNAVPYVSIFKVWLVKGGVLAMYWKAAATPLVHFVEHQTNKTV